MLKSVICFSIVINISNLARGPVRYTVWLSVYPLRLSVCSEAGVRERQLLGADGRRASGRRRRQDTGRLSDVRRQLRLRHPGSARRQCRHLWHHLQLELILRYAPTPLHVVKPLFRLTAL